MWYVLKLGYSFLADADQHTAMAGYDSLEGAKQIFSHLKLGYQFNSLTRIKGGKFIAVHGVQLFESFEPQLSDAMEAVDTGEATLICQAQEVDFEIPR